MEYIFYVIFAVAGSVFSGGIPIESENRCSPYNSDDYRYPQSVERRIIQEYGGRIYSPYTGETFSSARETDIEHIVARSEAHDSGLCSADAATRRAFARDTLNLTLSPPFPLNRYSKVAKDAGEWLPEKNRCWFVNRVVEVKQKYNLTMDMREAKAVQEVLAGCSSTDIIFYSDPTTEPTAAPSTGRSAPRFTVARNVVNVRQGPSANYSVIGQVRAGRQFDISGRNPAGDWYRFSFNNRQGWIYAPLLTVENASQIPIVASIPRAPAQAPTAVPAAPVQQNALQLYDDNGNGRITCAEARNHGIAPVPRGHPAYPYMIDRDNDGVVCE